MQRYIKVSDDNCNMNVLVCFKFNRPVHFIRNCNASSSMKCYKCGKVGYKVRTCLSCSPTETIAKHSDRSSLGSEHSAATQFLRRSYEFN